MEVLILRHTVDSTRSGHDESVQQYPTNSSETEENEISIVWLMRLVPPARNISTHDTISPRAAREVALQVLQRIKAGAYSYRPYYRNRKCPFGSSLFEEFPTSQRWGQTRIRYFDSSQATNTISCNYCLSEWSWENEQHLLDRHAPYNLLKFDLLDVFTIVIPEDNCFDKGHSNYGKL